jgi:hypothetical protein
MQAWSANAPLTVRIGVVGVISVISVISVVWQRWEASAMSSYSSVSAIATSAASATIPTHRNLATNRPATRANRSAARPAEPDDFASLKQSGAHIVGTGMALHRIASQRAQNSGVYLG